MQSVRPPELSCVVPEQDDLLHETLTVWEVLYYAAMLRLPQSMSHDAKKARVDDVINALGIQACKGTIIGARTRAPVTVQRGTETAQGGACITLLGVPTSHGYIIIYICYIDLQNLLNFAIMIMRRRLLPKGHQRRRAQARQHRVRDLLFLSCSDLCLFSAAVPHRG